MHRLLNLLGLVAFVLGAAILGYVLYLVLAGLLGFNPWGSGQPQVVVNTMISLGIVALILFVVGWLLARASARLEWRGQVAAVAPPGH